MKLSPRVAAPAVLATAVLDVGACGSDDAEDPTLTSPESVTSVATVTSLSTTTVAGGNAGSGQGPSTVASTTPTSIIGGSTTPTSVGSGATGGG